MVTAGHCGYCITEARKNWPSTSPACMLSKSRIVDDSRSISMPGMSTVNLFIGVELVSLLVGNVSRISRMRRYLVDQENVAFGAKFQLSARHVESFLLSVVFIQCISQGFPLSLIFHVHGFLFVNFVLISSDLSWDFMLDML